MSNEDDDFIRITLRLPKSLQAQLTDASARKRSMNAEIIARLEESFDPDVRAALFGAGMQQGEIRGEIAALAAEIRSLRFQLHGERELNEALENLAPKPLTDAQAARIDRKLKSVPVKSEPPTLPPDAPIAREAREVKRQGKDAPKLKRD